MKSLLVLFCSITVKQTCITDFQSGILKMRWYTLINKGRIIILALCLSLFCTQQASAVSPVEVFDVQKEEVVYRTSLNKQIENEATTLLLNASGLVTKIDPIPKTGYLIKVGFSEPISLNNPWFKSPVDQAVFVLTDEDNPSFMVINEESQSIFLYFNGKTKPLLDAIDFNIKS